MKSLEVQLNEAHEHIAFQDRVIASLKTELHRARLLIAQTQVEKQIAELPPDAKERLRKAFPGTDVGGLKQAVNIEKRSQMTKQDRRVEKILGD